MALPIASIKRVNVEENSSGHSGPVITFEVRLSTASDEDITFDYQTLPGTTVLGDFSSGIGIGTLKIPAGATTGLITLKVYGDNADEVDESLWLELFNPNGAVLAGGEKSLKAIGVVQDEDGAGSNLSLFVSDAIVTEGNSGTKTATFEVHLSRPHTGPLSFDYKTVNGSAKAGSDFSAESGKVTFDTGQTVATVEVVVKGDTTDEASEFFSLVVTPSTTIKNGTASSTGIATILDNDTGNGTLPVASIQRVNVVENSSGHSGPFVSYQVTLSKASVDDITIAYRTQPGTTVLGDFSSGIGTGKVTIPAGETTALITLKVYGDDTDEVDESFWIELFNPTGVVLAGGEKTLKAIGVVQDEDGGGANLSLFVSDATVTEGNSGTKTATFEVHLSRPHTGALSFDYKTVNGSAKGGSDFVAETGKVTFTAGQTVATVEVVVKGDAADEASEFFSLVVTPSATIKNGTASSTGIATILDNDTGNGTLPVASIQRVNVVENSSGHSGPFVSYQVTLSKASTEDITIAYRTHPGTTVLGDFSSGIGTGTLEIPAGETTALITLKVYGDDTDEVDESFWLELFNPDGVVLAGGEKTLEAIGVIQDEDGGGANLSLFVSDATVTEGNSGTKTATFEVHLSRPHTGALSFDYKTVNGSAKGGSDFVAETGKVTFAAGQTVATVEVVVKGDTADEASEFFSLVVTPNTTIKNGTASSTGIATILDNDTGNGTLPVASIQRVNVVENSSGHSGPFVSYQVTLSKASAEDITIEYSTQPGTAVAGDFSSGIGTGKITIPAGETTALITLKVYGDNADEVDESFWLELFNPDGAVLAGGEKSLKAIGVIQDEDGGGANLSLFVSDATVTEGNSGTKTATFEVHLSRPHTGALSFDYKTVNGSAKGGFDFVAETGKVTFAAGQTVATVEIVVKGDQAFESDETFSLVVTPTAAIKNGTIASTGLGTILNNDTINEVLYGTDAANTIHGGTGNDRIFGLAGKDTLYGDDGNDILVGGSGADALRGGAGRDTAAYTDATKGVVVNLADASRGTNDAKGDTFSSIENLTGSAFADKIYGSSGVNVLNGGSGNDLLSGSAGNDTLSGGNGADKLIGGTGADKLTGGAGADSFLFRSTAESSASTTGRDTIFDFSAAGGDEVDLSGIDASTKTGGNQTFDFIGTKAFSGKAGELRYEKKSSDTYVYADVNGDKKADFSIHFDDAIPLSKDMFVL